MGSSQGQQRAQSDVAQGLITIAQGEEKDPRNCNLDPFEVWTLPSLPLDKNTGLLFSLSFHGASRKPWVGLLLNKRASQEDKPVNSVPALTSFDETV